MAGEVEQVKERLPISEVIAQYVKLEKAGASYKARCPFHNEKTPSFFVSPARGTYYCFGCGEHGDIFTFVQKFEGVDFRKALETLAARAGVTLVKENPERRKEKDRLRAVLEEATAWFAAQLAEHPTARAYLAKRGLTDETIARWRVGYAPAEWEALRDALAKRGYSDTELLTAGLVRRSEKRKGEYYDYFRGRIIFPLFDASGRVVAFSAREFEGAKAPTGARPTAQEEQPGGPKYLNSPETPLFRKSTLLYGLNKAKLAIHKFTFSIVVEGQMDLLLCHQSGWTNAVAPSGTALTEEHLDTLRNLSRQIVLAFDADEAGVAAAQKAAYLGLSRGMNVKVARFPHGSDPADLLAKNPEVFREAIRTSSHIVDFLLEHLASQGHEERKFRLVVQDAVLPFVARIENRIDQAHFVSKVAARLALPEQPVWEEVRKLGRPTRDAAPTKREAPREGNRREAIARRLYALCMAEREREQPRIDTDAIVSTITTLVPDLAPRLQSADAEEYKGLGEAGERDARELAGEVSELLLNLEEESVREELGELLAHLRELEASGEKEKGGALMARTKELAQRISDLHKRKATLNG